VVRREGYSWPQGTPEAVMIARRSFDYLNSYNAASVFLKAWYLGANSEAGLENDGKLRQMYHTDNPTAAN
jgi:hypothetical protein